MAERKLAVVIGLGTAGKAAARTLAAAGWRVVGAEPGRIGGLCLWAGCVPKKALYQAADSVRVAGKAEQYGVGSGTHEIDWLSTLAWKWHAQETYAGDQLASMTDLGVEVRGQAARFISQRELRIGDETFEPDAVVVASGSRPVRPDIPGIELGDTSEDALHYPSVPGSLAILGGGYVAMEFAAIHAALGTRVTILQRGPQVLPIYDPDVAEVAARRLQSIGVEVQRRVDVLGMDGERGSVRVAFRSAEHGERTLTAERVLVATGRVPALETLALAMAGVGVAHGRPTITPAGRSATNPKVWFAGDAAGAIMLTPAANYAGRTVAQSLIGGREIPFEVSTIPSTTFTFPQIAQVGMTERRAQAAGIRYRISSQSFDTLAAAIIADERDGVVKLMFAEADDRLIGAHVAGPSASDMIYALTLAMRMRAKAKDIQETIGIHPAYCEAINWAAFR